MRPTARSKPISPTHRVNRGGGVSSGRFWTGVFINCDVETIRAIPSMRSADCSTDARRASVSMQEPVSRQRTRRVHLLRGLAPIIGRVGSIRIAAYVLVSLAAALAGSVAAIVLVPHIQPGHAPMFGSHEI